jgi:hypothetical protein
MGVEQEPQDHQIGETWPETDDSHRFDEAVRDAFAPQVGFAEDLSAVLKGVPRFLWGPLVIWVAGLVPGAAIIAFDHEFQLTTRYAALAFLAVSAVVWVVLVGRFQSDRGDSKPPLVARIVLGVVGVAFVLAMTLVLFVSFR